MTDEPEDGAIRDPAERDKLRAIMGEHGPRVFGLSYNPMDCRSWCPEGWPCIAYCDAYNQVRIRTQTAMIPNPVPPTAPARPPKPKKPAQPTKPDAPDGGPS